MGLGSKKLALATPPDGSVLMAGSALQSIYFVIL